MLLHGSGGYVRDNGLGGVILRLREDDFLSSGHCWCHRAPVVSGHEWSRRTFERRE